MDLSKETYTQEEVKQIVEEYNKQIAELTANLTQAQEQAKTLEDLQKQNLEANIKLELLKNGLNEDVIDLVFDSDIEKAKTKIQKISEILKKNDLNNAYRPNEHKANDEYLEAQKNKDVEGMIRAKLSKIFS